MMIITILVFIFILGLLIFSHEFGHFISAKKSGIRVDEFGFGLPPRIFGIKRGETVYSLNLLPFGGFVKIYGEDGEEKSDKTSFSSRPAGIRSIIVAAGVIMNVMLAIVLFSFGHAIGLPTMIEDGVSGKIRNPEIKITQIAKNSPAESAGLKAGDSVIKLQITNYKFQKEIFETKELQDFVAQYRGEEMVLTIKRGNETLEKSLTPRVDYPEGEGPLGIAMAKIGIVSYPWHIAPLKGFETSVSMLWMIISGFFLILKNLIISGKIIADIAGPVGIAVLTSQVTKLGFVYILQFTAFLSLNLAVINAMPFPALDGGRLLFLAIEKLRKKPVPPSVERFIHGAGFALLILLIIAVTFRDIVKLF